MDGAVLVSSPLSIEHAVYFSIIRAPLFIRTRWFLGGIWCVPRVLSLSDFAVEQNE